jgi:hypothetical protein
MIDTLRKTPLTSREAVLRLSLLAAIGSLLFLMHAIEPERISRWTPFATSCGAVTGLPCLFCGTTRALHLALNGEFSRALYFNWLSFPILGGVLCLGALLGVEIVSGRRLLNLIPPVRITRKTISIAAILVPSLWLLQVYLAVSQHKTELLNPAGPLYTLFVK